MTRMLAFGSWPSPIDAEAVAASPGRIERARFVGDEVWWSETVAAEGGRTAIRRRGASGAVTDVLPAPWNVRSRVHEYGGGAWATSPAGALYFVDRDQSVWMREPGGALDRLAGSADTSFGGLTWHDGRVFAVREFAPHGGRVRHDIVQITSDGAVAPVVAGQDFVAQPALSPDGERLAWIGWDHPDMPWDTAELRVGRLEDGRVREWSTVAGGVSSPVQPLWTSPTDLVFTDDPTGRWNLWHASLVPGQEPVCSPIAPADADTGGPLWTLDGHWYCPLADGRIAAVRTNGSDEVVVVDPWTGVAVPLAIPSAAAVSIEDSRGTSVLLAVTGPDSPPALWVLDVDRPEDAQQLTGSEYPWGAGWMPQPEAVTFDGPHGAVHAFDYAPRHPDVRGPDGEAPPYVVLVHGGPTSHVSGASSGKAAYFTSRGIGVLDVNYGGSSGYGRAYRERLRGQWGIVDVDDVAAAAAGLGARGRADATRLAIEGGSAGGWTVLSALTNTDMFAAGISRYGVGDARALAADTHDFEARYLDGLIGPLPDAEAVYLERSPLTHAERFRVPVLLLQGTDDVVVPPAQSEAIRDALAERGIPHAYVLYQGEGHGFRRRETVVDVLRRELAFLAAVFDLDVDGIEPLVLD